VIDRLASEVQRAIASPDIQTQLSSQGIIPVAAGPTQFADLITSETKQWTRVVKTAGVKIE